VENDLKRFGDWLWIGRAHKMFYICSMTRFEDGGTARHPDARRGRGAVSNASGRYESESRVALDDGWGSLDEPPPPLRTSVAIDATRTILARNESPDVGFDR
jgi:hypothetical protein